MVMVDIDVMAMCWWWLVVVMGKIEKKIFHQNDCDRIMQAMMLSKIGIGLLMQTKNTYQDAKLNTLVESNVRPHYFHKTNMLMLLLPVAKEI